MNLSCVVTYRTLEFIGETALGFTRWRVFLMVEIVFVLCGVWGGGLYSMTISNVIHRHCHWLLASHPNRQVPARGDMQGVFPPSWWGGEEGGICEAINRLSAEKNEMRVAAILYFQTVGLIHDFCVAVCSLCSMMFRARRTRVFFFCGESPSLGVRGRLPLEESAEVSICPGRSVGCYRQP